MSGPQIAGASRDWRENFSGLAADIAASPLPTRQLKRSTARLLAKQIATVTKQRPQKRLSRARP